MESAKRFLLIDDDKSNNMLCEMIIRNKIKDVLDVKSFSVPEQGLEYIEQNYDEPEILLPTVLLLDLNMPNISGWQFLERFNRMKENIKKQFTIYILSSSIDDRDKKRAAEDDNVKDYLVKPLSYILLDKVLDQVNLI